MTGGPDFRNIAQFEQVELLEWVCRSCGYGAVVPQEPPACPICRGTDWKPRPRRRRSTVPEPDHAVS